MAHFGSYTFNATMTYLPDGRTKNDTETIGVTISSVPGGPVTMSTGGGGRILSSGRGDIAMKSVDTVMAPLSDPKETLQSDPTESAPGDSGGGRVVRPSSGDDDYSLISLEVGRPEPTGNVDAIEETDTDRVVELAAETPTIKESDAPPESEEPAEGFQLASVTGLVSLNPLHATVGAVAVALFVAVSIFVKMLQRRKKEQLWI